MERKRKLIRVLWFFGVKKRGLGELAVIFYIHRHLRTCHRRFVYVGYIYTLKGGEHVVIKSGRHVCLPVGRRRDNRNTRCGPNLDPHPLRHHRQLSRIPPKFGVARGSHGRTRQLDEKTHPQTNMFLSRDLDHGQTSVTPSESLRLRWCPKYF